MSESKVAVVTGGAGFLGSHTVDLLLDQGYAVRVLDDLSSGQSSNLDHRKSDSKLTFDVCDLVGLKNNDPHFSGADYVFHFGGIGDIVPSIEHPARYMEINVMGTINALEAARHAGVSKFVYAASSSCYGLATELPTSETAIIDPQYPYALSKLQGEQAALHWGKIYSLPVISMRIFNAYGPRSRTTGAYGAVFGVFIAQKLSGSPFTVVGDGAQTRDFVFATDVARAFLLAAESKFANEIYNLGTGEPKPVNRIVELLGGPVVNVPKRPGEPECTWADTSKILSQLGWSPETSFEDGVGQMLRRIDDWRDAPVWDRDSIEIATRSWFNSLSPK